MGVSERPSSLSQLGSETAKSTNPDALRIAFRRFMDLSAVAELIDSALARFPHQFHAKPSVFRRLCRNWENSRSGQSRSWSPLKSGQWGLAKCGPVYPGEAPQLRETKTVGHFRDLNFVRVGVA